MENSKILALLRQEEKILEERANKEIDDQSPAVVRELFHELEVHQVELEMQNDELTIAHHETEAEKLKFKELFDLAPTGYFILDSVGIINDVNASGAQLLRRTTSNIRHQRFVNFVYGNDTTVFYALLKRMSGSDLKQRCELRLLTPEGALFYAQIEGKGYFSEIARTTIFYLSVADLSSRRFREQAGWDARLKLEAALRNSSVGVWEFKQDEAELVLDDTSYSFFGLDQSSFDRKIFSLKENILPEDWFKFESDFNCAIENNERLSIEFRLKATNGKFSNIICRGGPSNLDGSSRSFLGTFINTR